jgi:glycosyltransferase involved in cell wall biosynthesis
MNILHITNIRNTPNGIQTVLSRLIPEQIKLGQNVALASTKQNAECSNCFVHIIQDKNSITNLIDSFCPDIVIFHSLYEKSYVTTYKYLQQKKIPYIIMLHGALSKENYRKNHIKKVIANFLYFGKFLKNANSIIYLNQGEYDNSIVPIFNKHFTLIPNGCNIRPYKPKTIRKKKLNFVFMGRMDVKGKALDILFDALDLCQSKNIEINFEFYGNTYKKTEQYVFDRIKSLNSFVSYGGVVYGEEKENALLDTDIFVLTSRSEGMPMGVLEALSYGIPCILTPRTNMADEVITANAGWKCELNVNSIVETIEDALTLFRKNPDYYRKNAVSLAERYSWKNIAVKSICEYEKIINRKKS